MVDKTLGFVILTVANLIASLGRHESLLRNFNRLYLCLSAILVADPLAYIKKLTPSSQILDQKHTSMRLGKMIKNHGSLETTKLQS